MCIESFLRYIRYEKNFSSHTVLSYRNDLSQFVDYYFTCKAEKFSPKSVDRDLVRNWIVYLVEKGGAPRSISRKVSTLRSFFKFLVKEGVVPFTPIQNIQLPKISKPLPAFLKEEEIFTIPPIMASAKKLKSFTFVVNNVVMSITTAVLSGLYALTS